MPHPSRRKGDRFERECIQQAREAGLRAERAWGSDGRALTTDAGEVCSSTVDLLIGGTLKVQAKRRKALASYLKPPEGAHIALVREDRGETFAVVPYPLLLRMLRKCYSTTNTDQQ